MHKARVVGSSVDDPSDDLLVIEKAIYAVQCAHIQAPQTHTQRHELTHRDAVQRRCVYLEPQMQFK